MSTAAKELLAAFDGLPEAEQDAVLAGLLNRRATRTASSVRSGADLVAFWRAEGLIGSRPDITDSQTHARQLREQAQRRGA